jgi:hypothetical protein
VRVADVEHQELLVAAAGREAIEANDFAHGCLRPSRGGLTRHGHSIASRYPAARATMGG